MTGTGGLLLAIDTATTEAVVALGTLDGAVLDRQRWIAGHLHGERLLASVVTTLEEAGARLGDLGAIVAGIGPGSFTGMRVGMATAKGLAFGLGVPIVGVPTAEALARAAAGAGDERVAVVQPAGPSSRYRTIVGRQGDDWAVEEGPVLEPAEDRLEVPLDTLPVVIDGAAPAEELEAGRRALDGLPDALLSAGRERLLLRGGDDLAALVPVYVSLPRGAVAGPEGVAWSRARP